MKNRYSPIPSFLSVKLDSNTQLDSVVFSRVSQLLIKEA